ncbi:Lrp/AsnC family transcriptional regulator [Candidatus Thorarchaeota archaeon]|nr:MAG: Lrp/AsnC family transcriptional regulator [Candidatus Thorarchaeota archaeon]
MRNSHSVVVNMVTAVVLMHVEVGKAEQVYEKVKEIDEVEIVHLVTGPYDVIAYVELPEKSDYRRVVFAIHEIPGIKSTETCVSI